MVDEYRLDEDGEYPMIVDGENLSNTEVWRLIKLFDHECEELAGRFYDQCRKGVYGDAGRSEKFRAFWTEVGLRCGKEPEICYVKSHYQNFAEDVRREWAGLLGRPDVNERDKQTMHKALIVQEMLGLQSQHVPVQINKDSQQFAGDGYENRQTAANYGNHVEPSVLRKLMNSTNLTRH